MDIKTYKVIDKQLDINDEAEFLRQYAHCADEDTLYEIWYTKKRQEENLNLGYYKIFDLSPLRDLTQLQRLYLRATSIDDISSLKDLNQLKRLDLDRTSVGDIRPLKDLKQLKTLIVSDTLITDISPLKNLTNLYSLYIANTQISDLRALKDLTKLEQLDISNTQISDLKPLSDLVLLKNLNISNTKVSDLSPLKYLLEKGMKIGWTSDEGISIKGCPIKNPPIGILAQGNAAILRYWQELENKETITNNQTKLIFVGNSRAGKTSLWQFLKDKIYNDKADSTHGIKTEIWDTETLGTEDKQNLAAHIWDFGGQEYYHATHRLFLADNAVYVLVWERDSNKQGTRLEKFKLDDDPNGEIDTVDLEHFPASYWLENIRYFAGKFCPVLIVQNKVDSADDYHSHTVVDDESWRCFHISVKNAYNFQQGNQNLKRFDIKFQDFKETLLDVLRKNINPKVIVKYYVQVREKLEVLSKDIEYITPQQLRKIALEFDETPDMGNLLAYLSANSTILHFPKFDRLKERLYLKPTQVSKDIYRILNKEVQKNNGRFDFEHIQKRLNYDETEVERFIDLMKAFDLIFEKTDSLNKRLFVAPQYLLPKEKLGIDVDVISNQLKIRTAFYIRFYKFTPPSMMSRFIAHNGAASMDENYWKNGIMYNSKQTDLPIRVEFDHNKGIFKIDVQNKELQVIDMQNIVNKFVELDGSSENIEISLDCETFIDFDKLRVMLERGDANGLIYSADDKTIDKSQYKWLTQKIKKEEIMTLEQLKEEAHDLIGKAKTEEAMNTIALWAHENDLAQTKTEITLLKNAWTKLQREQRLGKMSFSESSIEESKINDSVLDLLKNMEMDTDDEFEFNEVETPQTFNELDPNGIIVKFLEYLMSNSKEEGTTHEFARKTGVHLIKVNNLVKFVARKGYITILTTLPKQCIVVKANYGVESLLRTINQSQIQIDNIPTGVSDKLKILMLTALPAKTVEINIDKEFARISKELQGNSAFDLLIENHVNQSEFKKFTETNQPDVLHFSGHGLNGGKQGGIVLQNDNKNGYELLSPDKLSFLFKYFKRSFRIQTVILNACLSEEQAVAISQHVPYVVGTTDEIDDEHSIAFSVGFYFKLVQSNRDFELAFDSGRTEAVLKGAKETDFVFYKNGKIWDIDSPQ